jgi:hypothetical protein
MLDLDSSIRQDLSGCFSVMNRQVPCATTFSSFIPSATSIPTPQSSLPLEVIVPVAVALGVALGVGIPALTGEPLPPPEPDVSSIFLPDSLRVPVNDLPFLVFGFGFGTRNCSDGSVRLPDGKCRAVLKRGPCSPLEWIVVDPETLSVTIPPF